jgi:hypothetical protein
MCHSYIISVPLRELLFSVWFDCAVLRLLNVNRDNEREFETSKVNDK